MRPAEYKAVFRWYTFLNKVNNQPQIRVIKESLIKVAYHCDTLHPELTGLALWCGHYLITSSGFSFSFLVLLGTSC